MVRRHHRFPRPRNLDAGNLDLPFVINVIEMQKRQDARIGALPPKMDAQIDRFEL